MNLTEILQSKINGEILNKIDEIRYNFITQRLYEEVYKGYIIAYHRTKDAKAFMDISNKIGFTTLGKGGGAMYGVGLYGNYTWEGVITPYSKSHYGDYIVKYIVKPNNVIFFDEYTQLKVYGKKMSILEQCDYWGVMLNDVIRYKIREIDDEISQNDSIYTSSFAENFFNNIILKSSKNITSQFYGISYNGHNDQDTIVMYNFKNLTVLGFYDRDVTFHKINEHNFYNIKSVSKNTVDNTNAGNLTPKDYHVPSYTYNKSENKIKDEIKSNLSTNDITNKILEKTLFDFKDLSEDESVKLFNKKFNINKNKTLYILAFLKIFVVNSPSYKVESEGVQYKSQTYSVKFNDIRFKTIPFKFLTSNQRVLIHDCDFKDLTFMFNSVYLLLSINHCHNLLTLDGIQNMKFTKETSYRRNFVELSNLPLLQSLEYIPKSTRFLNLSNIPLIDLKPLLKHKNIIDLTISGCPNIRLNDGLPPNIESIIYTNKFDTDIDLSLLNNYPNLTYADINGNILRKN